MNYEIIKQNYDKGLWNKNMVALSVKKGVITPKEYEEIVKESYEEL